ncbi:hypothetical protein AMST5_03866 [freshwater sediment metagenome]|uniref:Uncharacterized protein n=1 Tax=freshwater sediment metagenome TaxID=556182 RepID=A0AA48RBW4_9ZZZZ
MRRFDKNVAGVGERQKVTTAQPRDKIRYDVIIGANDKLERDISRLQLFLQTLNGDTNLRSAVVEETRQDMGRTGQHRHAVCNRGARHCDRGLEIPGAIVDARQNMAVKIDHHAGTEAPVRLLPVMGSEVSTIADSL